ncbi:hypothetical protein [Streptomyces sp. NPDC001480]
MHTDVTLTDDSYARGTLTLTALGPSVWDGYAATLTIGVSNS